MRKTATILSVLLLAACTTQGPGPAATGQFATLDCAALETERVRLVTELDAISAADSAGIEKIRADLDAVGAVQTEKGCAG